MKKLSFYFIPLFLLAACSGEPESNETASNTSVKDTTEIPEKTSVSPVNITPISHATMALEWDGTVIYVDPIGGKEAFKDQPRPDLILITDIHPDHLDAATIEAVRKKDSEIIAPKAVVEKLPGDLQAAVNIFNNGEETFVEGISIEAIPMYNLREEAMKYHPKGRGNGYILEKDGKRIYISGDTEGIPEMRDLKNIDIAFVCMNLPYTMSVEDAAEAVLAFKPAKVYPYHYRGENGLSRVDKFKEIVNQGNPDIEVVQLDWYPDM